MFIKEKKGIGLPVFAGARELNKQGRRNEANKIGEMEFGRVRGAEPITHPQAKPKQPGNSIAPFHSSIKFAFLWFWLCGWKKINKGILTVLYKHRIKIV